MQGVLSLLKSRKFWLSLAALVAAVGIIPGDQADKLAEAILVIVSVLVLAIGIEDGAAKIANGKK